MGESSDSQLSPSTLPRKASKRGTTRTVPQTDSGRWGENPQVIDRTVVKELGKLAP